MKKTVKYLLTFTIYSGTIAVGFFLLQALYFWVSNRQANQTHVLAFAAGRSGGHIVPARAIAAQDKRNNTAVTTLFFSPNSPLDFQLLTNRPEVDRHIAYPLNNIPRTRYAHLAWYLLKMLMTTGRAYIQLIRNQAKETITTGGYIALPLTGASWAVGIPVTLYELNAVPGSAARLVHNFATTTKCPFACAQKQFLFPSKTIHAPYPIRFTSKDHHSKDTARAYLGIDANAYVIAIIGGSQGSHFFNTHLPDVIDELKQEKDLFIIQQTGAEDVSAVKLYYQKLNIPALIFAFRSDIEYIYRAANICISRAGAGSIFELLFFSLPTIIIPLETAVNDHQLDNARALVAEHGQLFSLLRQKDIEENPALLAKELKRHFQTQKTN